VASRKVPVSRHHVPLAAVRWPLVRPRAARRSLLASGFGRGFLAMLPLWAGAIPLGVVYAVAARGAGLGPGEAQLMSLVVFSAAAQLSAVSLLDAGTPGLVLVATALALNAQLLLLGLAVGRRHVRLSWPQRLLTAWFLTDGAFGVAAARGRLRLPVLLGAGGSMYVAWNAGTGLGLAAGHALPDPRQLGLDVVAPLAFLAVLVPLLQTRMAVLVALAAGATALLLTRLAPVGVAVLAAGVIGSAVAARRARPERTIPAGGAESAREGEAG
jgi:predicted branched-subunit amino acid permease